jgi:hypothetical protein
VQLPVWAGPSGTPAPASRCSLGRDPSHPVNALPRQPRVDADSPGSRAKKGTTHTCVIRSLEQLSIDRGVETQSCPTNPRLSVIIQFAVPRSPRPAASFAQVSSDRDRRGVIIADKKSRSISARNPRARNSSSRLFTTFSPSPDLADHVASASISPLSTLTANRKFVPLGANPTTPPVRRSDFAGSGQLPCAVERTVAAQLLTACSTATWHSNR